MIALAPSRIAYTVLHQRHERVPEDRYLERFRAFEQAVEVQARSLAATLPPLADHPLAHGLGLDRLGQVVAQHWRTLEASAATDEAAAALERGRAYLRSLGFEHVGTERPVHESRFLATGAVHLDLLEHLVRDRMGIYQPPHSGVITAFDRVTFNVFNEVALLEPAEGAETAAFRDELILFFGKPGRPGEVEYADFREGLRTWLERLVEHQGARAEVWQRKLGLGRLREFIVRILGTDPDTLLRHASDHAVAPAVAEAVLERGALVAFRRADP